MVFLTVKGAPGRTKKKAARFRPALVDLLVAKP